MKPLQTLGLSALVAMALTVFIGVPVSSAAEFHSSASPVMLYGTSANLVFTIDGQKAQCKKAVLEKASQVTPTQTISGINAAYSECTAFGFAGATVNTGSCTYEFGWPFALLWSKVAIRCGKEGKITIKSSVFGSTCEVTIGEASNTELVHVTFTNNNPSAGKFLASFNVNGMTVNKVADNGLCPLSGTGSSNTATFTGPVPFEGTEGINVWVE